MGYFDENGNYHSHQSPQHDREPLPSTAPAVPNTVLIPCHHIRLGDILVLQGRLCQVIRISTSVTVDQHRYFGVDLFTKQLHEEASFTFNPAPNVATQTMLGPRFVQYQVLDMVDGKLLCMSETGDVIPNVPVIDQGNIWARIEKAFQSERRGVRVLAVQDNGRILAVDMKVVRARLGGLTATDGSAKSRPDDGKDELHRACRASNEPPLKSILRQAKTDVNKLDKEKRTALFEAVDCRFESGVRALLETPINLEAMDTNGKTVLDLALSRTDSPSQFIAMLLLQKGASPVTGLGNVTLELLSAAAEGDAGAINHLIVEGADVNCHDRLGYTPLHEAVSFGRVEIVELLLPFGANVNAELCLGGHTPLHMIIERGEAHRSFYGAVSERSSLPPLRGDHVALMETLPCHGAVASIGRFSDGATAQDLATQCLQSERTKTEKTILHKLISVLNSPPSVELPATAETELGHRPLAAITTEARTIWDNFSVRLQYHKTGAFLPRHSPIGSFIHLPECPDAKKCIEDLERWASKDSPGQSNPTTDKGTKNLWKWIHLPVNHKGWAKDILRALKIRANIEFGGTMKEREVFMDESFYEIRGSSPDTRLRRPLFSPLSEQKPGCFSMVMPFFDAERLDEFLSRSESPNEGYRLRQELRRVCPLEDLHTPCSLDQSYYLSLVDTTERDETQVVVKHINRTQDTKGKSPWRARPKLLMVNQLWLWGVDSDTILTAFPDRCCKIGKPNLLASISRSFTQRPPSTMHAMLIQILRHVLDFMDAPTNAGLDENLFDTFEQSIAYRAHGEMDCYLRFHQARQVQQTKYSSATGDTARILLHQKMKDEEEMCDIDQEIEHLREIKDIRDELKMIERVLEDQLAVITQFSTTFDNYQQETENSSQVGALIQSTKFRLSKVHRLNKDAESVETSLNHLLDLKQKQASLNEAHDSKRLADQADRRAEDSETQNQLLFVFTIVTVVFTPISFVSTFMAVPSRDFPQTENGNDIGWKWWQVLVGTLVTEIATFLVIAAFWLGAPRRADPGGTAASKVETYRKWLRSIKGGRDAEWIVLDETKPASKRADEEAGGGEPSLAGTDK